jgi:hypothetical protein
VFDVDGVIDMGDISVDTYFVGKDAAHTAFVVVHVIVVVLVSSILSPP